MNNIILKLIIVDAKRDLSDRHVYYLRVNFVVYHLHHQQHYSNTTIADASLIMQSTLSNEDPDFLRNDPGLASLLAQLERVNQQIAAHARFKEQIAEAKQIAAEQLKAKTEFLGSDDKTQNTEDSNDWEQHWDDAVGAEYYFNPKTGEASWLPPPIPKK